MDDMWTEVGYKDVLDLTKVVFPLVSPEPRKDKCEFEGACEGLVIVQVFLISHGVLVEAW